MQDAALQTKRELTAIITALTQITGLTSHWNGEVELSQDPRILGRKPFSCRIIVNARLVDQPARWRTLIHEALHSLSVGYNMTDYQAFLGWEEGVVEQTQRLLRPIVLERLGVQVDSSVFSPIEAAYSFNKYIRAIELFRSVLGRDDEREFYLTLLATETKRRHDLIFGLGNRLPGLQRGEFMAIFSKANSILKEPP